MSSIHQALVRLVLVWAALASGVGCVSSRAFVPGEHVTGFSPDGEHFAAEYVLLEEGTTVGDVKLWSEGAARDGSAHDPRTTVRVGFEITNQSREPLRFDEARLFLEELPVKGKAPGRERPAEVDGDTLVPGGESRRLAAIFELPSSVWPSDVPGYRVGWTVHAGRAHSRKTPFLRAPSPRPVDPWGPWYAPYYGYYPGFYGSLRYRWPPGWRGPRYYYYRPYRPYWP